MSIDFRQQRGLTLIELIVFIVIVGVGLAGVLMALNLSTQKSADPLIAKQLLAIAESILEEVVMQPFSWCDPDDPNAASATSTNSCSANAAEGNAKATYNSVAETRGSAASPLDNVSDYHGETISNTISGSNTGWPAGYQASVAVAQNALNDVPASESLRISVTASRGSQTLTLQGYRLRHSPTALP